MFDSKDPKLERDCEKCLNKKLKTLLKVQNTFVISKLAIAKTVCKLKRGKAPGLDGICPDNLRHGTDLLFEHITLLFQMCVDYGVVPSSFCAGVLSNISKKGKTKIGAQDIDQLPFQVFPVRSSSCFSFQKCWGSVYWIFVSSDSVETGVARLYLGF